MEQKNGIFLDWVRLSCPNTLDKHYMYVEDCLRWRGALGDKRRLLGYEGKVLMALGFFGWRFNSIGSPSYRTGFSDDSDADERDWFLDALMEIPGELCAQLGSDRLLQLCREMDEHGFDATRLDVTYDCRDEHVNVKSIEDMFKRKQIRTRSESRNAITGSAAPGEACTLLQGGTLRIGGRQSEMFMKVYDKRQQHLKKTGIDIGHCTRFELEIKGERAKSAFRAICDGQVNRLTGEIVGPFDLGSLLRDFICFYKTPKQKEVCDWWQAISDAPPMVWPEYEHHVSLDATLFWMQTQVLPTWKALEDFGFGPKLLEVLKSVKPSRELTRYLKKLKERNEIPV